MQEDLNGDHHVVALPWQGFDRIKIVFVKLYVRDVRAVAPRVGQLVTTQVHCSYGCVRKMLCQQFGDPTKPAAELEDSGEGQSALGEDIQQKPLLKLME